jgi:carboxypeptidase C (cathepsin A)
LFKTTSLSLALLFKNQVSGETEARMFFTAYTLDGVSDPLKANIKTACYEAGHMMYIDLKSLAKLKQDVAAFIRDAVPAR